MRIGVDLQVLSQKHLTGVGKYALNISRALLGLESPHEFIFFVPQNAPLDLGLREGRVEIITLPQKRLTFWSAHVTYARIMQQAKLDVLFGPANTTPWFYLGRTVITIHDLAIYRHPEWFPTGQTFATKYLVPRSIRRAERIIVPSRSTKADLTTLFEIAGKKVQVIPHGVEERFFSGSGARSKPYYILFLGTLEPRKNLKALVQAYGLLPKDIQDKYELWIAGEEGWGGLELGNVEPGIRGRIRWLGYVPEHRLPELYQNAAIFCYPSLYEGFGMPVLEALAGGAAVVTSNISSLPEVLGDAGVLIDPTSAHSIAEAIIRLIRDGAYLSQISKLGIEQARQFTWQRAATETLHILEKAAKDLG